MDPAGIDWTAVIIASIAAGSATIAAWQARIASREIRENNRLLATAGPVTIGEHIDAIQADLVEQHRRVQAVAEAKLEADARLARAALQAVAKLASARDRPAPVTEVAREAAVEVLVAAAETAAAMSGPPPVDPT